MLYCNRWFLEPISARNGTTVTSQSGHDIRFNCGRISSKGWPDYCGDQRMDDTGVDSRHGLLPV